MLDNYSKLGNVACDMFDWVSVSAHMHMGDQRNDIILAFWYEEVDIVAILLCNVFFCCCFEKVFLTKYV